MYYTLSDYPHDMIEIECAKCGRRHGRLRTARLIEEHGLTSSCRTCCGRLRVPEVGQHEQRRLRSLLFALKSDGPIC